MLKLLLVSDLHLGMEKGDFPSHEAARAATFRRICGLANRHDALLVGGDLFDGGTPPLHARQMVEHEFKVLADNGIPVLFSPGEHDTAGDGKLPGYFRELNAGRVFDTIDGCDPHVIEKDGHRVYIYGMPALEGARLSSLSRITEDGFHIGLLHAEFNLTGESVESAALVLNRSRLKDIGFDFYALGHSHQFKLFKYNRRVIGAYPGSPEAVTFSERGERYALSISLDDNEITQIARLTVNTLDVDDAVLDCRELGNFQGVLDFLEAGKSDRKVLRLTLNGDRNFTVDFAVLMNYRKKFDHLIVNDESNPTLDVLIEESSNDDSLKGDFFKLLKKEMENGSLPGNIDRETLAGILNCLLKKGEYEPEEWLCG